MIDLPFLSKINQMRNTSEHPHAGALFSDGITPGYIHNPNTSFLLPCSTALKWNKSLCPSKKSITSDWNGLKKVRAGVKKSQGRQASKIKLFCAVYTYSARHTTHLAYISKTWARQCDGFLASSNLTDASIGAVNMLHQGEAVYNNMWQKVRSTLAYIYDHYLEDYDYFHICGDDTYVVVENLKSYLDSPQVMALLKGSLDIIAQKNSRQNNNSTWDNFHDSNATIAELFSQWKNLNQKMPRPLLLGYPMDRAVGGKRYYHVYPAGAPGYTINKSALKFLVELIYYTNDYNLMQATDPREDVFIGGLLHKYGINCADTRDEKNAWRYHIGSISDAEDGTAYRAGRVGAFSRKFEQTVGTKLDSISEESVAFHLKSALSVKDEMERYHLILNGMCDKVLPVLIPYIFRNVYRHSIFGIEVT
jgi:glycoprotein-N-acetylgalactosamine 3-beta-galactosyltransferase